MHMRLLYTTALALGMGGSLALIAPTPAHACGGTFCDAGPAVMDPEAMPIDQTGETIVFVVGETHVEAHIQIQYDPESGAERFAWIIPILGTNPEFTVGSQRLFVSLQNATVPSYGYINNQEFCGGGGGSFGDEGGDGWDGCDGTGAAGDEGAPGSTGGGEGDDGATTGGGVEVVGQDIVGAFDIVVLQSETADDLMLWLGDNEFYQDPLATPIFQEYIDQGALFAAVSLNNDAGIGEIHPIVMRYEGNEPCVPIRLTRVAAQEDMDIRAFFLSSTRVYPTNYRHVELNPLKLDWISLATNYKDVVTMAVDTPMVDGHGFVTEYAGPTSVVPRDGLYDELWSHTVFETAIPVEVPALLTAQGLLTCEGGECTFFHPLIQGILASFLPVPDGVELGAFYECVECYEAQVDLDAWDGVAFAQTLNERIIEPGLHALTILDENVTVTRLYTTLSPIEMTLDPTFHADPAEFAVKDDTSVTSTRYFDCSGTTEMQLPGGARVVKLPVFDQWPDIAPEEMPWVERVTEQVIDAAPVVLLDNTQFIDVLLAAWNSNSFARSHACGDTSGYTSGGDTDSGGSAGQDGLGSGCGCRTDGEGPTGWSLALLAMGLGALRRRRQPTSVSEGGSEDASLR
jgi:MYXO-CTERM domain-containing protein